MAQAKANLNLQRHFYVTGLNYSLILAQIIKDYYCDYAKDSIRYIIML